MSEVHQQERLAKLDEALSRAKLGRAVETLGGETVSVEFLRLKARGHDVSFDELVERAKFWGLILDENPLPFGTVPDDLRGSIKSELKACAVQGVIARPDIQAVAEKYHIYEHCLGEFAAKSGLVYEDHSGIVRGGKGTKAGSPLWSSNFFVLGSISLLLALLLAMCVGVTPNSNETREQRTIREMQEGQKAVCRKWGGLRPECR